MRERVEIGHGRARDPGRLNEQLRAGWFDRPNGVALERALADVLDRVRGSG